MGKRGASEAGLKDQDDGMMKGNALAGGDINRRALFVHNLRAVNDQFSKWIAEQASTKPDKPWEFGVQSYLKHLKKIEADFKDVVDAVNMPPPSLAAPVTPAPFTPAPSTSIFATPAASTTPFSVEAGGVTNPFGSTSSANTPFGSTSSTTNPFGSTSSSSLFGFTAAQTTPGAGLFGSTSAAPAPLQFNIPGTGLAPSSLGTPASTGATPQDGDDEDAPEPTSPTKVGRDADEEILFETRSQLMILTDNQWKSGGVGQLTLRKPKDDPSAKAHIVMTTQVGRVMLNASLHKGMAFNRPKPEKVQTSLMAFEDGVHKRKTCMFRFKTGDIADEFISGIQKESQ